MPQATGTRLLQGHGRLRERTQADLKKAYRKLAKQLHPDVNQKNPRQERFKAVSEAYSVLGNDESGKQYERCASWAHPAGSGSTRAAAAERSGVSAGQGRVRPQRPGGVQRLGDILSARCSVRAHLARPVGELRPARDDRLVRIEVPFRVGRRGREDPAQVTVRHVPAAKGRARSQGARSRLASVRRPRPCRSVRGTSPSTVPARCGFVGRRDREEPMRACVGRGWSRTQRTLAVTIRRDRRRGAPSACEARGNAARRRPPGPITRSG